MMIFIQIMSRYLQILQILLSLSIAAWAAAGCCAPRQLPSRTEVRDSVAVRVVDSTVIRYVDVEVPVPVESSRAVVPDSSHLETSVASSDASVDSLGRLHHSLDNKPVKLAAQAPVKDTFTEKTETETTVKTETVTEYVEKPLTRWQEFRLKAFWWMAAIIAAGVAIQIARIYLH